MFAQVVEVGEDPVGHEHRHLDLLHETAAAFIVRASHHRDFVIDTLRDHTYIVPVGLMLVNGHPRHERLRHRQHLIVILGLTSLKSETIFLANLSDTSKLIPARQEAVREGDQFIAYVDSALRVVVVDE